MREVDHKELTQAGSRESGHLVFLREDRAFFKLPCQAGIGRAEVLQ